jgi:3-oxoacyl-[acyl-carrier-protein] synthase-3
MGAQMPEQRRARKRPDNGRYAHVIGWGIEVPERVLTNHDLEQMMETSDEWITERTGIKERRLADGRDNTVTLGLRAAHQALRQANVLPDELDLIIVATSSLTYLFPATACLIQDQLGATRAGAFDILAACTGFIYALGIAAAQIKSGAIDTALVIGTETLSRLVDWNDRGTCILFGDGAGAFVVQASDIPGGIHEVVLHSDGSGGDLLYAYSGMRSGWDGASPSPQVNIFMNGREVFRFASRVMVTATQEVIARAGVKLDDIALIVPHQANLRIIEAAARGLKLPLERFMINIERYGNTSTASIPIAIVEAVQAGRIKPNDKILLVGFGAGLTWGAALIEWAVKPTPISYARDIIREGWYILARVRSLLLRLVRFVEALLFSSPDQSRRK